MLKSLKVTLLSVLSLTVVAAGSFVVTAPVQALDTKLDPSEIGYSPSVRSASNSTVQKVMNTVYMIAGMIAVLMIIIAGIIFVTSRGDSNQVARAKQAILGAVIGLIFIMFAFVITQFVIGRIGG